MSSVNIEKVAGQTESPKEDGENGAKDQELSQAEDGVADKTRETDPDGREEGREAGKPGQGDQGETGKEGGEVEEPSIEDRVNKIVEERLAAAKPKETPPVPKELSEEQWQQKEEEWGGVSRKTIQQTAKLVHGAIEHITQIIDQRLSRFERGDAISSLSKDKEFSDAQTLRPHVEEFMNSLPPQLQNDPNMLKRAVIYARGVTGNSRAAKASNSGERHRKIVGAGRPAAPSAGGTRKGGLPQLTSIQKDAARAAGMSEEEYRVELSRRGRALA